MIPELLLLSDHLRARTPNQQRQDQLLADVDLVHHRLLSKPGSWFRRKPR